MRPARLMVMIIVGLSLLVCCCALPRCDGRWRGWDWGYTPVGVPEAEAGYLNGVVIVTAELPAGVAELAAGAAELSAQAHKITVSSR